MSRRRPFSIVGLAVATVAGLGLLVGACTALTDSTSDGTGDDPDATTDADDGVGVRIATSATCAIDATCLAAIETTYGLDLHDTAVTLPDRRSPAEGLARGVLDVAITTADDPYLAGSVLLTDDAGALVDETVVPVVNGAALAVDEATITEALANVGSVLDTAALTALRAAVEVERQSPGDAAAAWLASTGLAPGTGTTGVGTLSVGADQTVRSQVLAEVFARTLTAVGLPTTVVWVSGGPSGLLGALEDGQIALAPATAGTWLETIGGFLGEASPDADAVRARLAERLTPRGLVALESTAASAGTVVAMDGELAQRIGVASIADLAALPQLAGPPATVAPTTSAPTTGAPTTGAPTTMSATTVAPTTPSADSAEPTTKVEPTTAPATAAAEDAATDSTTAADTATDPVAPLPPGLTARAEGWGIGASGPEVLALQDALREVGLGTSSTGTFDEPTRRAVRAAQRAAGLVPDGVATPVLLSALGGAGATPAPFPRPGDAGLLDPPAEREGRPAVYLAVAGGPDPTWTPQLLDLLDRAGAEATFFVTAGTAAGEQELVRRVVARGHGLGATTRPYAAFGAASREQAIREVATARRQLATVTVAAISCVRLPEAAWLEPAATRGAIAGAGGKVIADDVDLQDLRRPPQDALAGSLDAARPGDVVVVHDGLGDRTGTLNALDVALQTWSARGWRAVAIPACVPVPDLPTPPTTTTTTTPATTTSATTTSATTTPATTTPATTTPATTAGIAGTSTIGA